MIGYIPVQRGTVWEVILQIPVLVSLFFLMCVRFLCTNRFLPVLSNIHRCRLCLNFPFVGNGVAGGFFTELMFTQFKTTNEVMLQQLSAQ